ncbi:MAG: hypothetical protein H0V75_17185 [Rubrobacter sp.]|nr:hypothetical protein [Rubrobacter sp.]
MIMAGTMDSPTGLETVAHIFVADASDYYEIPDDGLPRLEGGGTASWFPTMRIYIARMYETKKATIASAKRHVAKKPGYSG